jgi:hypothetical protein
MGTVSLGGLLVTADEWQDEELRALLLEAYGEAMPWTDDSDSDGAGQHDAAVAQSR